MYSSVRKAVIPVAGLGTRFLPITKVIPKELLPILDRPSIHYVVEELVEAGIEEIIFVFSPGREQVLDYFCEDEKLSRELKEKNKLALIEPIYKLTKKIKFKKAYQERPLGLGHAIGCAAELVGEEPFVVFLPDDLVDASPGLSKVMVDIFIKEQKSVVAVEKVPEERVSSYGIIHPQPISSQLYQALDLVEKPKPADAPSQLAIVGRYVFTPQLFAYLRETKPGALGEIQVTDAMRRLASEGNMLAYELTGARLDVGNKVGWLEANNYYAKKYGLSVISSLPRDL